MKRASTDLWKSTEMAYREIRSSMSRCRANSKTSSGCACRALKILNCVKSSSGVGGSESYPESASNSGSA